MRYLFANRASARLATDITSTSTTIVVSPGEGSLFPSPGVGEAFRLTIVDVTGAYEIVECTARSLDTLTVSRAREGTVARAFSAGSRVELRLTAGVAGRFLQSGALPPLERDLDFNGYAPINVNWSVVSANFDSVRERGVAFVPVTRSLTAGPGLLGGGVLSADRQFELDFATDADMQAGTSTTKVVTPARVSALLATAFSRIEPFPASLPAIVAVPHGFPTRPKRVTVWLRCRQAINGYAVGDLVPVSSARRADSPLALATVIVSSTQIKVVLPNNLRLLSADLSQTVFDVTALHWELLFEAGQS